MTGEPLVSIVIPTWQRHDLLLGRCLPSVAAQSYPNIEIVVVSDGPDPDLAATLTAWPVPPVRCFQLPEHGPEPHWGAAARRRGCEVATGALIGYCDDDDALRPDHVALLAAAFAERPGLGFAYSRMVSHNPSGDVVIGYAQPALGQIGTPMIMHRPELLEIATWGEGSAAEDWDLIGKWLAAGVTCHAVDAETVDVWPSNFR